MRFFKRLRPTILFDMLALAGLAASTIGAGLIYRPLWWILPGLAALALGLFGGWACRDTQTNVEQR